MSGVLIRGAEVEGRIVDVRLAGARIAEVGVDLAPATDEEMLDAAGGALLPGLYDAHLHLLALAAADRSIACGPPAVADRTALAAALAAAPADLSGWVRGVGYIETVAGELDAAAIDALHGDRPVRIQHRSGALWMVNSAGAERLGLDDADHPGIERGPDGRPTGRLWRADDWLRARTPAADAPGLAPVGARLAALGITSVCDATPDLDHRAIAVLGEASASRALPQRLQLLGVPLRHDRLPGGLTTGPYKIVIADSALPDPVELSGRISGAHAAGRPVAVHCVTREALVLLLVALESAGVQPGDRVEHAALVPADLIPQLARLGLRVVTQPGFLAHRGDDYLRDVPAPDVPDLYRCRSLLAGGVRLALSSDAPYGPLDPWAVMAAAVARRTATGVVVGSGERLTALQALAGFLSDPADPGGPVRHVRPGAVADLVLLDRPLASQLEAPTSAAVLASVAGGLIAHRA